MKDGELSQYIYQRLDEILEMSDYADVAYSLDQLMKELAHNYKLDTGKLIGEPVIHTQHQANCPSLDGFGCRCEEEL